MTIFSDTREPGQTELGNLVAVASAFGLTIEESPTAPLGGAINEVIRVRTDQGNVVIRIHRPEMTPARLTAVHAIQDQLQARGLPLPATFQTKGGATWTSIRGRLAEVLRYVPGGREAETWDEAAAAFAMLGRLHNGLRVVCADALPAPVFGCFVTPSSALALLAATEPAVQTRRHHPAAAEMADVRARARMLLGQLQAARRNYVAHLPRQMIHGDFVGYNVLISGGRVIAILDFDRMAVRERIYDLACALFVLLNRLTRNGLTQRGPNGSLADSDLNQIARLLQRYASTVDVPLTGAELSALPYEMARTPLYPVVAAELSPANAVVETLGAGQHLAAAQWLADQAPWVGRFLLESVEHVGEDGDILPDGPCQRHEESDRCGMGNAGIGGSAWDR